MRKSPPLSPDAQMPFIEHLLELRSRLLKVILAIFIVLFALMPFSKELFTLVAEPLMRFMPENTQMIAIDPAAPFLTPFKLTFMVAVFITIPIALYHFWAFVAPGLYKHEKALIMPLLVSSVLLFYLGMIFAYYVVFPLIFGFMVSVTPIGVAMMTDISRYLDFTLTVFFAFGAAFEVPIVVIVLVWTGLVTPEYLTEKRPYIIVAAFIIGMLLTPPDVISQTLLAVPMWLLFEAGLFFSRWLITKKTETSQQMDLPK
ncbi:MAG: twin arginine-targeting protein translocase TatC [Beggiatoa sp. IS2]|nr:MAG: twin arginine-targeting protein translocase TatC [Beggiatoa sp. IS2]